MKPESEGHPDPLTLFCQSILPHYSANWPPSEWQLAEKFVSYFGIRFITTEGDIAKLCGKLNIKVTVGRLPEELRGYHSCFAQERAIWLSEKGKFLGATVHTLLHELREILEHIFADLGRPTVDKESLEARAESFAIETRIAASFDMWKTHFEGAKKIQSIWRRRAAYVLIGLGTFIQVAGCAFLPYFEDYGVASD